MAKKTELKERYTKETLYPVTITDAILDLPEKLGEIHDSIGNLSDHVDELMSEEALTNLLAYGVEWDINVADPHLTRVGNLSMHKTLPIQSQLKGCIAQGDKIMYWLNEDDWTRKKDPVTLQFTQGIDPDTMDSTLTVDPSDLTDLRPNDQIIINFDSSITPIARVDVSRFNEGVLKLGSANEIVTSVEIGARLDGYDGTVKVYCPEFYIKSFINGDKRKVMISTHRISNTWVHQPALLLDAYRSTVLNTVPINMGYLSTLPVNSAISVVNTATYCRGGANRVANDKFVTGADNATIDVFRSDLGKPRTQQTRAVFRTESRNAGSEMLNYIQYKNIFYWLWVIEYANFNSQEAYNEELTSEGYRQGGMGPGVTTMGNWSEYNGYCPLTPCGYGNSLGNKSGIKTFTIPEFTLGLGVITNLNNASIAANAGSKVDGKIMLTAITTINNSIVWTAWNQQSLTTTYRITGLTESGETIRFETGSGASVIKVGELSEDGEITINWPKNQSSREFRFSELNPDVNITIEVISAEAGTMPRSAQTIQMARWRGFDNPFGDIWTNLDGIIIKRDAAGEPSKVFVTNDPSKYGDTLEIMNTMDVAGTEVPQDGYIKLFDLGSTAEIIPSMVGASTTTYKCDYHWCNQNYTDRRTLLVGGGASYGAHAGLGRFVSYTGVSYSHAGVGFRSVSLFSFS